MNKHLAHRDEFPRLMAELGVEIAVEIGSAECWFASKMLQCETLRELVLVDPWLNTDHWKVARQFAAKDKRVKLMRTTGLVAAQVIGQVHMVYEDAMHDYSAVHDSLVTWGPKVTMLHGGHDYTFNPLPAPYANGVILAVEEYYADVPIYVVGAAEPPNYIDRLRAAYAAAELHDLGPWNSHNPSWYVFK